MSHGAMKWDVSQDRRYLKKILADEFGLQRMQKEGDDATTEDIAEADEISPS